MAKDPSKPMTRTAALAKRVRARSAWFGGGDAGLLVQVAQNPRASVAMVIAAAVVLVCSVLAIWARERPILAAGRVMNDTRVVRVPLEVEDAAATEAAREAARQRTPRVYVADVPVLDEIQRSIEALPRTVAAAKSIEQVEPTIREQFAMSEKELAAVQAQAVDGQPSGEWIGRVRQLAGTLRRLPLLDDQTWQKSTQEGLHSSVRLVIGAESVLIRRTELVNVDDAKALPEIMATLARDAGFTGAVRDVVVARLTLGAKPTYRFDTALTATDQKSSAERIMPIIKMNPVGQVIFARGDVLTPAQLDLAKAEMSRFIAGSEAWRLWLRRLSLVAAVTAIVLAMSGYTALFCPRIRRNPARVAAAAALITATLAAAVLSTAADPRLAALSIVTPSVFLAVILAIVYEQRVALAFGVLHATLVCVALDQSIGTFAVMITGVGTAVWQLKEIRDRNKFFRVAVTTALGMGVATILVGLIDRPISEAALEETFTDGGIAAVGGLLVGGVTLFILPTIERAFDVTTGMTLIELRDPKHPLLRELQQRAPGTYNHSLNVAAIAEAAADAIGANALLTYVGALYHDIGKMNKPDYFVENQTPGVNKHDKLSPAMSLLIIVAHVKDGMELAREFNLPRTIQHFIESHHGTTLVEYFFHRAKKQALEQARAEGEDPAEAVQVPDEFDYRYPGPKPRTKETAIVMLSDAIESTTRTLPEPTPARIEAVVGTIAQARLADGQFDDCEITLRDVSAICESITKTLTSIYHGRVTYASTADIARRRA